MSLLRLNDHDNLFEMGVAIEEDAFEGISKDGDLRGTGLRLAAESHHHLFSK
jgi:hypothetical protein